MPSNKENAAIQVQLISARNSVKKAINTTNRRISIPDSFIDELTSLYKDTENCITKLQQFINTVE